MRPYFVKVGGASGVDLKSLGVEVGEAEGLWASPTVTLDEQSVYRRAGAVLMDDEPATVVRELALHTTVMAADPDDFEAKLLAAKRLFGPVGRKDHLLVFGHQTSKQITARYVGLSDGPTGPQMAQSKVPVTFRFRSLDPYFVDVTPTTLGPVAANTPLPIPLGTGLSTPSITVTFAGSFSSVTITYKSSAGATLAHLVFTHAFVSGDVLVSNHAGPSVSLNGVRNESLYTSGEFFRLSPLDGVPATPAWGTIETNHGTLTVDYRSTWE